MTAISAEERTSAEIGKRFASLQINTYPIYSDHNVLISFKSDEP